MVWHVWHVGPKFRKGKKLSSSFFSVPECIHESGSNSVVFHDYVEQPSSTDLLQCNVVMICTFEQVDDSTIKSFDTLSLHIPLEKPQSFGSRRGH